MADTEVEEVIVEPPKKDPVNPKREGVPVYAPQLSVIVKKTINRKATVAEGVSVDERVQDSEGTEIDLTPFLGRGSVVSVRLSTRNPDSGQFSISFPDQMHADLADSIYGLVEPMDVVEIRMARESTSAELPIVLRGFISEVNRQEGMGDSGPIRTVTITGQNYSKILNIIRVIYLPTMIPSQLLLTNFSMFINYGVESTNYDSAAAFVTKVVDNVVGEFLEKMRAGSGGDASPILSLSADAVDSPSNGEVQPFGVQDWQGGSITDLLTTFGDVGAWNELYVEERDDGPCLVYRPTPFRNAAGDLIQGGTSPSKVKVIADDVVSIQVRRTDANVANYFWVEAPRLNLVENVLMRQDMLLEPSPSITDYQNASPTTYGIRLMQVQSNQGMRYDGKREEEVEDKDGAVIAQVNEKRRVLIENNKDNAVLEEGSMTLKGSEKIKAGFYVDLDRGGFETSYYAHEVEHQFTVGVSFLTNVVFDRGTGFIQRLQRGDAASPYLAELTTGGVYE